MNDFLALEFSLFGGRLPTREHSGPSAADATPNLIAFWLSANTAFVLRQSKRQDLNFRMSAKGGKRNMVPA
jgi:hypothetical protein